MASSAGFKPIDPERDEFRRYLERNGVIEALTKVIIRLVKERPQDPLEYLRNNLGDAKHEADQYKYLKQELEDASREVERLRKLVEQVEPDALKNQPPPKGKTVNAAAAEKENSSHDETEINKQELNNGNKSEEKSGEEKNSKKM